MRSPDVHKNGTLESYENVPERNGEPEVGTWQCIKENPKVVLWTLYANLGAMMIGYDNLTLAVCLSMPAFQYGVSQFPIALRESNLPTEKSLPSRSTGTPSYRPTGSPSGTRSSTS